MIKYLEERFSNIDENGIQLKDLPLIAALIFIAAVVVIGELVCALWLIAILVSALSLGATKLLMLIPCLLLLSIFSSAIVFVAMSNDDSWR